MSNAVALKNAIANPKQITQFKYALPPHITPEKFQRVAITAINNAPDIANCSVDSVMTSLMKCAQDGLLPDNRDAALVKFGSTCQYMPMVGGLIKRMKNSGELSTISAGVVYEHDRFEFVMGDEERMTHEPKLIGERGKPILAYAIAKFKDGGIQREVMTVAEIEKVRAVSKTGKSGPWVQWWDEMAKKTAIHRLAKRVPTSAEIESLIQRDVKISMEGDDTEETATPSLVDNINQAIDAEIVSEPAVQIEDQRDEGISADEMNMLTNEIINTDTTEDLQNAVDKVNAAASRMTGEQTAALNKMVNDQAKGFRKKATA